MATIDVQTARSERLKRLRTQASRARAIASVVTNAATAKALSVEAMAIDTLIDDLIQNGGIGPSLRTWS